MAGALGVPLAWHASGRCLCTCMCARACVCVCMCECVHVHTHLLMRLRPVPQTLSCAPPSHLTRPSPMRQTYPMRLTHTLPSHARCTDRSKEVRSKEKWALDCSAAPRLSCASAAGDRRVIDRTASKRGILAWTGTGRDPWRERRHSWRQWRHQWYKRRRWRALTRWLRSLSNCRWWREVCLAMDAPVQPSIQVTVQSKAATLQPIATQRAPTRSGANRPALHAAQPEVMELGSHRRARQMDQPQHIPHRNDRRPVVGARLHHTHQPSLHGAGAAPYATRPLVAAPRASAYQESSKSVASGRGSQTPATTIGPTHTTNKHASCRHAHGALTHKCEPLTPSVPHNRAPRHIIIA